MRTFPAALLALSLLSSPASAGFIDDLVKQVTAPDDATVARGLSEALRVGTENAVNLTGREDGFLKNPKITIPLPQKLEKPASLLRKVGAGKQVDEFVTTLNRAAEKAAPQAKEIFWETVKRMTFDDARRILQGGDTAATDYFREKTSPRLVELFRPAVTAATAEVGATRSYKKLIDRYRSIPFTQSVWVDIDQYVTEKAVEGLFLMVAEEERRIRKDPAARVTELLRKVFG